MQDARCEIWDSEAGGLLSAEFGMRSAEWLKIRKALHGSKVARLHGAVGLAARQYGQVARATHSWAEK
jgi:hypothetical protein